MSPKPSRWRRAARLLGWPTLASLLTMVACMFIPPAYTARTTILPRVSTPSWASDLSHVLAAPTTARYAALLRSQRLNERILDHFALQGVYREYTRTGALQHLVRQVRIGSVNGLLAIQVDDPYPWRAADIANQYVIELRRLLDELRVERAQAGAKNLAQEVHETQRRLAQAQQHLQSRGYDNAAWRLDRNNLIGEQGDLTESTRAAELQLLRLRAGLQDHSIEVQNQQARLDALRRLQREMQSARERVDGGYAGASREVQRLEALLRQLRLQLAARETEAQQREESLGIVDRAQIPRLPSSPMTLRWMLLAWGLTLLVLCRRPILAFLVPLLLAEIFGRGRGRAMDRAPQVSGGRRPAQPHSATP